MAQISDADKKNESQFMTLFWELIKDTYVPEGKGSEYWDDLMERVGYINSVCESAMDMELLSAYMEYLNKRWKRQQGADNGND